MKVKIKYSSTQKFIVQLEESTLGSLRNKVKTFIENTYNQSVSEPLILSLNGSDPLHGSDDTSLASLGVVAGDLLMILLASAAVHQDALQPTASSSPTRSRSTSIEKSATSKETTQKMEKDPVAGMAAAAEGTEADTVKREKSSLLEVQDGHPSLSLENLFTKCLPSSASEAVNLMVHLTMIECGFHLESSLEIPPGWKEMVATFQYCHNSFPQFKCTLALVTMGEVKQVLASFPQQETPISVQVKAGEYVKDSSKLTIPAGALVKVAHLSRTLRDHILHPLQVAAHEILGIPAPWHLAGLPHEMLLVIASSLGARCVLNLGETCRRLHSAMKDNKLWRNLYKRDYKNIYNYMDNYNNVDWKAKYKEASDRVKEWKVLYDDSGMEYVIPGMLPPRPPFGPPYPTVPYPEIPRPRGPNPYPPQPHPTPNPFHDPDSPFFGGDIPQMPNPFPNISDPFDPFGMLPRRPRPGGPFNPPFMPRHPRNPRGPRFDYI